jgi:hypothetical protein
MEARIMADRYGRMDSRDRDDHERYASDRYFRERELEREDQRARTDDPLEDYGQADFSRDYRYDPETRTGYRVDPKEDARRRYEDPAMEDPARFADEPRYADHRPIERDYDRDRPMREERSWAERSGLAGLFGGRTDRRSNDRVLWVVATEALHRARGLDDADIHVRVDEAVVTLEGTVRSREEKRRAEDLVDQRGVRDVHNNLRIRERRWGF